ncbi:MAG: PLP-dependent transferase [Bacteroidales bacterium]|nr:PLP-dependent transferase [Bacteroidales bacterium]MBN2749042.1 PLP-dependent transferase [Bacteroidales bacterium]
MLIDLRSDTVTRPTEEMLKYMMQAPVGDDVLGEDPTVNALEQMAANLFGREAAIFCPSGTMTNQIAIKLHTQPGDEVICDRMAHIYNFEGGGIAFNSSCSVRLLNGDNGRFTAEQVREAINPDNIHHAPSKLIALENTCNKGGGAYYSFSDILAIKAVAHEGGIPMHLDGARLFNALEETCETPVEYGLAFDTISICLSKGLGAPVGSLLIGSMEHIKKARRYRKVMGGAMRQAGYLAAAGIYALENNIARLADDHRRAKAVGEAIGKLPCVKRVLPVDSNIIIFTLDSSVLDINFLKQLKSKGILASGFGPQTIRMVTHLDFTEAHLNQFLSTIRQL